MSLSFWPFCMAQVGSWAKENTSALRDNIHAYSSWSGQATLSCPQRAGIHSSQLSWSVLNHHVPIFTTTHDLFIK